MSETLEMLNIPRIWQHDCGLPKKGLFQRQLLAASLDLCSLALHDAEESLEHAGCRAHEDSPEEMIPYLFFPQHRKSHPITTPCSLKCSLP